MKYAKLIVSVTAFAASGAILALSAIHSLPTPKARALAANPDLAAEAHYRAIRIDDKGQQWVVDTQLTIEDCRERTRKFNVWECEDERLFDLEGNPLHAAGRDGK